MERICPKTGKRIKSGVRLRAAGLLLPVTGFLSLIWFLIRVIPKPSRAAYPCQRMAAPLASTFVLWLLGLVGSAMAYCKGKACLRRSRVVTAWLCFAVAAVLVAAVVIPLQENQALADIPPAHSPVGVAKGIHPGRVVWVHAPEATDWAGYNKQGTDPWWLNNHTDAAVVEGMFSKAVRNVAGESTDEAAWAAIFDHFNYTHKGIRRGYQDGEKIAVKINLATCMVGTKYPTPPGGYDTTKANTNCIDNSPQMLTAMLRQLVSVVGVAQTNITIGDPTGLFPNHLWNVMHAAFPDVHYLDNSGGAGRTRSEFSSVPFYWSTNAADGKLQDYIPTAFAEADYFINFAVLKGHSAGITVCGKNLYGALIRCPDGALYNRGDPVYRDYYDMHLSLPNVKWSPGRGRYRAIVDLMGHRQLGGKTLLYLVDGLFAGYYSDAKPMKWLTAPFNNDWPSSLFASQDPVAIDSVCYDFLNNEWPGVVANGAGTTSLQGGAEDYLHEAALAGNPPSGTFYDPERDGTNLVSMGVHEHWNNPLNRQYSRNLGLDQGIELVALPRPRPRPTILYVR